MNEWLVASQPKLKGVGTVLFIVACNLIPALSTDMYTPALPTMVDYFNSTSQAMNSTMLSFTICNPIALLAFGPLSDKYGRRPILLIGSALFALGCLVCMCAQAVIMLVVGRAIQACGAGAMTAMATAIVKDAFVPDKRELVLSVVTVMFVVGPVAAPILGAIVITWLSWRVIFGILLAFGALCMVLSLLFTESLPENEKSDETIRANLLHLGSMLKTKGFTLFIIVVCMVDIPFMIYIATASYIYIDFFQLSALQYSLFFAFSALVSCTGPVLWLIAQKHTTARNFVSILMGLMFVAGVLVLLFGHVSPFLFCGLFLIIAWPHSSLRPMSTNIMLLQHEGDTGAASSVINTAHSVFNFAGMLLAMLPWTSYITAIGVTGIVCLAMGIAVWIFLLRSNIICIGIKD